MPKRFPLVFIQRVVSIGHRLVACTIPSTHILLIVLQFEQKLSFYPNLDTTYQKCQRCPPNWV